MKTNGLTNRIVKAAIEALENGDRNTWLALFEPDAERYDDGSPRSLRGVLPAMRLDIGQAT